MTMIMKTNRIRQRMTIDGNAKDKGSGTDKNNDNVKIMKDVTRKILARMHPNAS